MKKIITFVVAACTVLQPIKANSLDLTNRYPVSIPEPSISSIQCDTFLDMQCVQEALQHWRERMQQLNQECKELQQDNLDLYNKTMDIAEKNYNNCLTQHSQEVCGQSVYNSAVAAENIYNSLKKAVDGHFDYFSDKINERFYSALELCCLEEF